MASSTHSWRSRSVGIMGAAAIAIAALAGGVTAQAPSPAAPTIPSAAGSPTPSLAQPEGSAATPDAGRRATSCRSGARHERGVMRPGRFRAGLSIGFRGRVATVSGIDGPSLTLMTADGWTRTVDTTGVPITRGDATIGVADVRVGDTVGVAQRRADDGTWQVSAIRVRLTVVRGTIAAVAADGFTLTTRAATSTAVRVSDATSWGCRLAGGLATLEVGDSVVARGVTATDGSLDATAVTTAVSRARRHARSEAWHEARRERRDSRRERRERVRRGMAPSQGQTPTAGPSVAPSA